MSERIQVSKEIIPRTSDLQFALEANGIIPEGNSWRFSRDVLNLTRRHFSEQEVAFFGPGAERISGYFGHEPLNPNTFAGLFNQQDVLKTVAKYRSINDSLGTRVAYLLGGILREIEFQQMITGDYYGLNRVGKGLRFTAQMAYLAEEKSVEAVTSAVAHHVISGGATGNDQLFAGWAYHMADAVRDDPVTVNDTVDLGLSQIARLKNFLSATGQSVETDLPDISDDLRLFEDLPTVGAEFHFSKNPSPTKDSKFWKRIALLNMSQYQRDSYIQFSRMDRGIVEVRMNPSAFPVTVANWKHIRKLIPEIEEAYFTVTLNRREKDQNFTWGDDRKFLYRLKALSLLTFAALYARRPRQEIPEEINFGSIYLGQTVRFLDGVSDYSGVWGGKGENGHGQLGIYSGYGQSLPHLSYYPTMAIARPDILSTNGRFLDQIHDLDDAFKVPALSVKGLFNSLDLEIATDPELNLVREAGNRIVSAMSP